MMFLQQTHRVLLCWRPCLITACCCLLLSILSDASLASSTSQHFLPSEFPRYLSSLESSSTSTQLSSAIAVIVNYASLMHNLTCIFNVAPIFCKLHRLSINKYIFINRLFYYGFDTAKQNLI